MTMQETSDGSKNRAIAAMASDGAAEFGVGLEGGIEEGPDGKHFESGWCTVVDRGGIVYRPPFPVLSFDMVAVQGV